MTSFRNINTEYICNFFNTCIDENPITNISISRDENTDRVFNVNIKTSRLGRYQFQPRHKITHGFTIESVFNGQEYSDYRIRIDAVIFGEQMNPDAVPNHEDLVQYERLMASKIRKHFDKQMEDAIYGRFEPVSKTDQALNELRNRVKNFRLV